MVQKRGRWTKNTELLSERVLRKLQSYLEEKKGQSPEIILRSRHFAEPQ